LLEIDGSLKSGSGTILRLSLAISAILNEPLHITNIRLKRPKPGLKPQHLEAVLTAGRICNATIKGAKFGSKELWFYPNEIEGGEITAEIGTAGSIPMLLITVLPMCAFAKKPINLHVTRGGTDVTHSPTINYMMHVFFPLLARMGLKISMKIHKYGYFPKGMGEVYVNVIPNQKLRPISLEEFGSLNSIQGKSVCTFLRHRKVAERQAKSATSLLTPIKKNVDIEVINDSSNPLQKGSSLTLWATTNNDVLLGADSIGEIRKSSEVVGREAANRLLVEIQSRATMDLHLGDLLIPYIAIAEDESTFLVRSISDHLETNIWLIQENLDAHFNVKKVGKLFKITKKYS
jgi:RNA 3'-terminal phosphate cyclase (ATP)